MSELAVIGLGKMGLLHAGLFSALREKPVKVASEEDGLLARMARRIIPGARVYRDYKEMVSREELDVVVIATPLLTHAPIILDLLNRKADLSLFVEEPLAASYEEARKVCEAAQGSTGIHMVGFQRRYAATFRRARELVANGNIGAPWHFKTSLFMSNIVRKGEGWRFKREMGGVMLEAGPHVIDLVIWLFGEPSEVSSVTRRSSSEDIEDYVQWRMTFPEDLTGYADISWSGRSFRAPAFYLEVEGSNGKMIASDSFLNVQLDSEGPDLPAGTHVFSRATIQPSVPFLLGGPEFCMEDKDFLLALQSKRQPESDFKAAAKVNLWIDRIRNY